MRTLLITIISVAILFSCGSTPDNAKSFLGVNDRISNTAKKLPSNITVDDNCISGLAYESSNYISETEKMMIEMSGVTVSTDEVNEFGDLAYENIKKDNETKLITSGNVINDLKILLKELVYNADLNSGINYKIHLIEDKEVNAFTVGGHIFVTTGIIEYANSRSAIAFVVGHEIGHNENGDLEMTMKKLKIANTLGDGFGDIGLVMQQLLTPFYNQVNEGNADIFGADISYQSGYNPRKGVDMWDRMAGDENKNDISSFARSHPFSADRSACLNNYIKSNFNL